MKKLLLPLLFVIGCGSGGDAPTLKADIFGWTGDEFVSGLPPFEGAQSVQVSVTQPSTGTVLKQTSAPIADRSASLPEVDFGEGLRLEIDIVDGFATTIGSGATPLFDFEDDLPSRNFRVQIQGVNTFAPVGSVVVDNETGGRKFAQSQFDYRGLDDSWLGRTGHAAALTDDGQVLVVGGGDPIPGSAPGLPGEFRKLYRDIQLFNPETGYFTNIDFDEATGLLRGSDLTFEPVVHHQLTAIGDNRFLVTGGFTEREGSIRPVNTIQLIDLNAAPGARVSFLNDAMGASVTLLVSRGRHQATFRENDNHLVITGGIGPGGDTDALDSFEMIDLSVNQPYTQTFQLSTARSNHSAVLLGDGATIWLTGGLNSDGATASTEVITLNSDGTSLASAEAAMGTARFGHAAVRISEGAGDLIVVVGGFTGTDGATTALFEVSKLGRGDFATGSDWALNSARGGVTAIELPNSKDVIVFGGKDTAGETLSSVERLSFLGLAAEPPYAAEELASAGLPRFEPSVTMMNSGRILVVGGEATIDGDGTGADSAEVFNPADPRPTTVTIQ